MKKKFRKAYDKGYKQAQLDYSRWFMTLDDGIHKDIARYQQEQKFHREQHAISEFDAKINFRAQDVFGSFEA